MFRVTSSEDGYCMCQIAQEDLISFDGVPSPTPGTDMGGISGGPALLVTHLNYPLVGVITAHWHLEAAPFELLRIATLERVEFD